MKHSLKVFRFIFSLSTVSAIFFSAFVSTVFATPVEPGSSHEIRVNGKVVVKTIDPAEQANRKGTVMTIVYDKENKEVVDHNITGLQPEYSLEFNDDGLSKLEIDIQGLEDGQYVKLSHDHASALDFSNQLDQ